MANNPRDAYIGGAMNTRAAMIGGAALLLVAAAGAGAWLFFASAPAALETDTADNEPLPIPPVPPRIAEGPDYEHCLGMLTSDPVGAASFALAWEATGGGDGATHCLALSQIALGEPARGAEMLDTLAAGTRGPDVGRAVIYGQATQAWLMAGEKMRAFGSATLALALSPDDADLLIESAIAAAALERYQDAIDDLTHALDIDGRRGDALTYRASAWRHMGQLELAQDDIDRAIAIDPDNPEALLERGIIRQRRNDPTGARTDWERTIMLAPNTPTSDLAQQNLALLEAGPVRQ
jgi:tetratricopeptide (TPR) repeat protein